MILKRNKQGDSEHMMSVLTGPHLALRQFLQTNIEPLQSIIRSYVVRTSLAHGEAVQTIAEDILHEAAIEALAHAEAFLTVPHPQAWFLAIAANILKRKRAATFRHSQHELSVSSLTSSGGGSSSDSDFFEQFTNLTQQGPEQDVEIQEQVTEMLALVSPEDQRILHLAILQDWDNRNLALALNVPQVTARVRLHRALNRLRTAWHKHEQQERER